MITPEELDSWYKDVSHNLKKWAPDGIIEINLEALASMGLLNYKDFDDDEAQDVTQFFHVIESPEKITLHNEKFAIWIVPKMVGPTPTTWTYVSQIQNKKLSLELVFSNSGVYNTPKFILKVLQHLLVDVIDTEAVISSIGKKPPGTSSKDV